LNLRMCRSLLVLWAVLVVGQAKAQDTLLRTLPGWAKVVVTVDLRDDTESMKTARRYMKPEQTEALEQLLYGLAQAGLMAAGHGTLDIQKDIISLVGKRGLLAFDPAVGGKTKESFMLLVELIDGARAQALIEKAIPQLSSLAPKDLIKSSQVGGATLWTIGPGQESVTLAIGPNALGVSDKLDTIKDWLAGPAPANALAQRAQAAFARLKPGLLNVYVDETLLDEKSVLGGNPVQEFLKLRSVVGSLTYGAEGVRYEVAGLVADGSAVKKLAASLPAGAPRGFSAVADDALVAVSLASISSLLAAAPLPLDPASMLALVAGPLFQDVPPGAINAVLQADLAIALTKLDLPPGVTISLVGKDAAGASQALAAIQALATKTGLVKVTEEMMDGKKVLKLHGLPAQAGIEAVYAAVSGASIIVGSDQAALSGALNATKTLTAHPTFQKILPALPQKSLITVYAVPAALIQKAGIFGTQMAGVRNKYLDRAFELIGKAFPFYASSLGVDDDGIRLVSYAGLDHDELQKLSSIMGLLGGIAGALVPAAYATAGAGAEKASTSDPVSEVKPVAPAKPKAPATGTKPATGAKKSSTKK